MAGSSPMLARSNGSCWLTLSMGAPGHGRRHVQAQVEGEDRVALLHADVAGSSSAYSRYRVASASARSRSDQPSDARAPGRRSWPPRTAPPSATARSTSAQTADAAHANPATARRPQRPACSAVQGRPPGRGLGQVRPCLGDAGPGRRAPAAAGPPVGTGPAGGAARTGHGKPEPGWRTGGGRSRPPPRSTTPRRGQEGQLRCRRGAGGHRPDDHLRPAARPGPAGRSTCRAARPSASARRAPDSSSAG